MNVLSVSFKRLYLHFFNRGCVDISQLKSCREGFPPCSLVIIIFSHLKLYWYKCTALVQEYISSLFYVYSYFPIFYKKKCMSIYQNQHPCPVSDLSVFGFISNLISLKRHLIKNEWYSQYPSCKMCVIESQCF